MTRDWKALGLAALLAAAVCAPQARPADPEKPNSVPDQLKEIHAALLQMNQNFQHMANDLRDMGVRGARAVQDIRDLQDRVSLIENQLRSQHSMLRGLQSATQDLRDLQDRLALEPRPAAGRPAFSYTPPGPEVRSLEERVAALEARLRSDERRFSFTPEAPRRTGTLRLENRSPYEATFTVNGNPYVVPAYETRLVRNVPAGAFTYEVSAAGFGVVRPASTSTVDAGATRVLYVNPGRPAQPVTVVPGEALIYLAP